MKKSKLVLAGSGILLFALFMVLLPTTALAAEEGAAAHQAGGKSPISDIAKALAIAVAVFGGAFGQGMATSRAVESIARNPWSFTRLSSLLQFEKPVGKTRPAEHPKTAYASPMAVQGRQI
jgi:F0F1-type ATP synthase membrane subunit c/vacuolar-type H+-ATPase subunit K